MASTRVNQVLTGIKNLSVSERRELAELLSQTTATRSPSVVVATETLLEKANAVYTAPIGGSGCACCGK